MPVKKIDPAAVRSAARADLRLVPTLCVGTPLFDALRCLSSPPPDCWNDAERRWNRSNTVAWPPPLLLKTLQTLLLCISIRAWGVRRTWFRGASSVAKKRPQRTIYSGVDGPAQLYLFVEIASFTQDRLKHDWIRGGNRE
jgi:hypothetical protein